ncbi:MAG TPA: multiubiquitin domain-containing protein [Dehalococcoidia bacterium]|nr:multiubiquitin domain-containing protein [Dehalococcoidia bacterium]
MTTERKPHRPKYQIDIEGTLFDWDDDTIAVPQIRSLGHLPSDTPVLEIDKDNDQRELREDEVVEIRPGHAFAKKVRFARG